MTTAMTMVGIGASAGGLEALQGLFGAMPADSGMAFVVVTHLAPGRKSAMAEILGRATRMPVSDAQDGTVVQPDHVYLIPPDRIARAVSGRSAGIEAVASIGRGRLSSSGVGMGSGNWVTCVPGYVPHGAARLALDTKEGYGNLHELDRLNECYRKKPSMPSAPS